MTPEDKELLRWAAKAAGIKRLTEDGPLMCLKDHVMEVWNPLEDDGDAFRLAVTLGMIIDARYGRNCNNNNEPIYVNYWPKNWQGHHESIKQEIGDDALSTTRRAIVRAAAEIGRKMK